MFIGQLPVPDGMRLGGVMAEILGRESIWS